MDFLILTDKLDPNIKKLFSLVTEHQVVSERVKRFAGLPASLHFLVEAGRRKRRRERTGSFVSSSALISKTRSQTFSSPWVFVSFRFHPEAADWLFWHEF